MYPQNFAIRPQGKRLTKDESRAPTADRPDATNIFIQQIDSLNQVRLPLSGRVTAIPLLWPESLVAGCSRPTESRDRQRGVGSASLARRDTDSQVSGRNRNHRPCSRHKLSGEYQYSEAVSLPAAC